MIKTISHEQLTPLNAILNLSYYHLYCFDGNGSVTTGELKYHAEVIWSSAKMLEYGTQSQLSQLKIENASYEFNYKETSRADLKKQVENVAKPFRIIMLERDIKLKIL